MFLTNSFSDSLGTMFITRTELMTFSTLFRHVLFGNSKLPADMRESMFCISLLIDQRSMQGAIHFMEVEWVQKKRTVLQC